ncbi:putative uridylyltransferase [subsurface metagenome]
MMNKEEVIESFSALGQDHLFDCWTDWDTHKKSILLEELVSLDLRLLSSLQKYLPEKEISPSLSPIPYLSHDDIIKMEKERELGRELISGGKTAFLTVAGGQGSRLGFKGPKGLFPISPIQKHSLLQIFAEKLLAAEIHYRVPLFWYIMTSPANYPEIVNYFRKKPRWSWGGNQGTNSGWSLN